jgi:MFS transporter, putative metabolite:H+ symporter
MATEEAAGTGSVTADEIATRLDRLPFLPFHLRIAGILGAGTLFDAFDSLSMGAALTMIVATFRLDYRSGGALISAAFGGQFVGAIAFGYLGERIGRKWAFVIALSIFAVCSLGAALAQSVNGIIIARIIQGVGLGAEVPVAAALFAEFVRGSARGRFLLVYESLFTWGIFLAPVAGLACYSAFGPALGWRVLFGIGGIPLIFAITAIFKLPESARWLASKGRLAEADGIVREMENQARVRGRALMPSRPIHVMAGSTSFTELFKGIYARRTFVVWTHWFCSYFVSNGFQSWAATLYMTIGGLPIRYALMLTIVTSGLQLCGSYTLAFTVDRLGRVPWFTGSFLVVCAGAALGAILTGPFAVRGWQPLLLCGIVMTVGNINGLGVYVYTPELYPTRMRAWATAMGSSFNRLGSFIAPSIVGILLARYGSIAIVFAMFSVVALFGAVVMGTLGEETKRRTLEELSP